MATNRRVTAELGRTTCAVLDAGSQISKDPRVTGRLHRLVGEMCQGLDTNRIAGSALELSKTLSKLLKEPLFEEAGSGLVTAGVYYHNRLIERPEVIDAVAALVAGQITMIARVMAEEDTDLWMAMTRWGDALADTLEHEDVQQGVGAVGVKLVKAITSAVEANEELVQHLLQLRARLMDQALNPEIATQLVSGLNKTPMDAR